MKLAIADSLLAMDTGSRWDLPDVLPPLEDLKRAEVTLAASTARADDGHAKYCFAKIVTAFNPDWSRDAQLTLLQFAVWREALSDLPNDLWSKGTLEIIQTHVFGMPKPAHFRKLVEARLQRLCEERRRVAALLDKARETAQPATPAREPLENRLRGAIWRGWRDRGTFLGPILWRSAVAAERQLAALEAREPARWVDAPSAVLALPPTLDDGHAPRETSPEDRASLLRSSARFHRDGGRGEYAAGLDRQASQLECGLEPL